MSGDDDNWPTIDCADIAATAPPIPDDIKAQVAVVMGAIPEPWMPGDEEDVADATGLAILVERERCAEVARQLTYDLVAAKIMAGCDAATQE